MIAICARGFYGGPMAKTSYYLNSIEKDVIKNTQSFQPDSTEQQKSGILEIICPFSLLGHYLNRKSNVK